MLCVLNDGYSVPELGIVNELSEQNVYNNAYKAYNQWRNAV